MPDVTAATPRARFTFRGNVPLGRHGWLRLTPAYSVTCVRELLDRSPRGPILDPFCGTGTTLLACAERGIACTTVDLNPFLVWLAETKAAPYGARAVDDASAILANMAAAARSRGAPPFLPAIHRVDRWWNPSELDALGRAFSVLASARERGGAGGNLATIAFCRTLIDVSNVSFGHQSMSFRKNGSAGGARTGAARVSESLLGSAAAVVRSAASPIREKKTRVLLGDSRDVDELVGGERFAQVITSPPYPNRMSYVRELRPYMYWLGYLVDRKDAGELDWRAIGGTWGAATSRLSSWTPDPDLAVPYPGFSRIVARIREREPLLANYVHRYFEDMVRHVAALARVLLPSARVHYVVGNSKFYDVLLPAHEIFAALFRSAGLRRAAVTELRKRTSKAELFEYLVEADAPRG